MPFFTLPHASHYIYIYIILCHLSHPFSSYLHPPKPSHSSHHHEIIHQNLHFRQPPSSNPNEVASNSSTKSSLTPILPL
ncbi:hypothetical protein HanIR_Chr16g0827711 [Helianthus annuus]|nr:hypothetical protein HanIR_Chr16g0827711 [Helianthus annuus]